MDYIYDLCGGTTHEILEKVNPYKQDAQVNAKSKEG
jgi:hypothetical protein